jgi:hypothetical protein
LEREKCLESYRIPIRSAAPPFACNKLVIALSLPGWAQVRRHIDIGVGGMLFLLLSGLNGCGESLESEASGTLAVCDARLKK